MPYRFSTHTLKADTPCLLHFSSSGTAKDCSSAALVQFYEEVWAGKLELMDELIAEEHAQRDMVWQACPFHAHRAVYDTTRHARLRSVSRTTASFMSYSDWASKMVLLCSKSPGLGGTSSGKG